ncbi:rare lipoprotein A [Salibacterium halotolerans]|uniref:Rare lipoprotein A n=2 Tax=Salibacterium halotolerans TaxID=1884432 RepID=A0A1I5L9H7_9BACI|nr:rare lipoprotein A [Salibacterium halotolerans]
MYYYPYVPPVMAPVSYSMPRTFSAEARQQTVQGQATWTQGGPVTKCGMPWSAYQYMTAAVGESSPYSCGQNLKIRYPVTGREMIVTIVDQVAGYPPNRLNLQKRVFEALGADPAAGVIPIEITPSPELEEERWGRYLLEITQNAYPNYNVTNYQALGTSEVNENQTRASYEFTLQSPQETRKIQASVTYNPETDRVVSFDIQEM